MATTTETTTARREMLASAVAKLNSSESFARFLKFRASVHSYSWANTLLIWAQAPEARIVMGYGNREGTSGWKSIGCQVRKGEKAIRIFAPIIVKKQINGVDEKVCIGFRTVNVFGDHQVEGDVPTAPVALLDGAAPADLFDRLSAVATAEGVTVSTVPMTDGANGLLSRERRLIFLGEHLSEAGRCKTLAHELAHWFDPDLVADPASYAAHRSDAECVAESSAYIVCQASGLATDAYSVGYVATWAAGDGEMLTRVASRIDKASGAILRAMEG